MTRSFRGCSLLTLSAHDGRFDRVIRERSDWRRSWRHGSSGCFVRAYGVLGN